jgi:hypothetical protein
MSTKKYLDLEGLGAYHSELVNKLVDLEYEPEKMFENKVDLFSLDKWGANKYGRVVGLRKGLMVTVENQIWQLENPARFNGVLSGSQSIEYKTQLPPDDLGWTIVGNTVDFNVNNHILELTK